MSDFENPPSADHPAGPRPAVLRLMRAIGVRLRAPLPDDERDALVVTLAATARSVADVPGAAPVDELAARRSVRSGRLRALAAAAAVLAVVVGAVGVVNRAGDDLPVLVLADGAPGGVAATMGGDSIESMRGAEPMIGIWNPTVLTFELADGVTIAVPRATAWRLVPPRDVASAAAGLAATLGLPAPTPTEWDPSAFQTQTDGGANLWVSASGDWYYGGPSDLYPMWDCPEPDLSGGGDAGAREPVECMPPAPPAGVPTAARARTLAGEFLASVGHADVRVLEVMADEWGAFVQSELILPGSATSSGVFIGVGFGAEGRVLWANGTLARAEAIGDYPLIDLAAALERLERDLNAWLDGDTIVPMPRPYAMEDGDTPTSDRDGGTSDTPTSDARSDGDGPVSILPLPEPGRIEPGLIDPGVDVPWQDLEPVERTVRIVTVELVTSAVWTAGGESVLLPHYRLVDTDGGWWFVIAVEDRYVQR